MGNILMEKKGQVKIVFIGPRKTTETSRDENILNNPHSCVASKFSKCLSWELSNN